MVCLEILDPRVNQDQTDQRDSQGLKDHKDQQVLTAYQGPQETQGHRELRVL